MTTQDRQCPVCQGARRLPPRKWGFIRNRAGLWPQFVIAKSPVCDTCDGRGVIIDCRIGADFRAWVGKKP